MFDRSRKYYRSNSVYGIMMAVTFLVTSGIVIELITLGTSKKSVPK
jgi:hypothetical protein